MFYALTAYYIIPASCSITSEVPLPLRVCQDLGVSPPRWNDLLPRSVRKAGAGGRRVRAKSSPLASHIHMALSVTAGFKRRPLRDLRHR